MTSDAKNMYIYNWTIRKQKNDVVDKNNWPERWRFATKNNCRGIKEPPTIAVPHSDLIRHYELWRQVSYSQTGLQKIKFVPDWGQ